MTGRGQNRGRWINRESEGWLTPIFSITCAPRAGKARRTARCMRQRRSSLPRRCCGRCLPVMPGLDTRQIEDVILGCVTPVGEQGANIARTAVLMAGYDESVPGVQVNRFCASALEAVNMATAKVASGQSPMAVAGGVEAMSRVPMASDGGAWATDPAVAISHLLRAAGHQRRPDRHTNTASAATIATPIRSRAISGPRSPGRRGASALRLCR